MSIELDIPQWIWDRVDYAIASLHDPARPCLPLEADKWETVNTLLYDERTPVTPPDGGDWWLVSHAPMHVQPGQVCIVALWARARKEDSNDRSEG